MQAGWQAWRRPPGQPGSITCKTSIYSSTWLPILTCSCSENSVRQIGQEESGDAVLNSLLWGGEIWQIWKVERPGWRLLGHSGQIGNAPNSAGKKSNSMLQLFSMHIWYWFEFLSMKKTIGKLKKNYGLYSQPNLPPQCPGMTKAIWG